MNIILIVISIILLALMLSLRSMKDFLSEIAEKEPKPIVTPDDIVQSQNLKPPQILEDPVEVAAILKKSLTEMKSNVAIDLIIEKVYLDNKVQFIIYDPNSISIWSAQAPPGYVIEEQKNKLENSLAEQYIIRHKYNDVFYYTYRSVSPTPAEYNETGIDKYLWNEFYSQQHKNQPDVSLTHCLISEITGIVEVPLRRTLEQELRS